MPNFCGTWTIAPLARGDLVKSAQFGPLNANNERHFQEIVREQIARDLKVSKDRVSVTGVVRAP